MFFVRVVFIVSLLIGCGKMFSQVIEVDQSGSGDFIHIQEGIDYSQDGDTVLVYPGIYYENVNFNGKNITLASLYLLTHDESFITSTIIDANNDGSGVMFLSGEDSTAILCGFTIQNGSGMQYSGLYNWRYGGGIVMMNSKSTVRDCIIEKNRATVAGGGICVYNAILYLSGTKIRDNYCYIFGGGIAMLSDSHIQFDTINLNDIYLNYAPRGCDFLKTPDCPNEVSFMVDTFTVLQPDYFYISSPDPNHNELDDIDVQILHGKVEPVNSNLYVDSTGDNANSGLTPDEPLQSISFAFTKIVSDSLHHNTIYLAPGIYSPTLTNEYFPLRLRRYVSLIGGNSETTILDAEYSAYHFWGYRYADQLTISDIQMKNGNGKVNDATTPANIWFHCDSAVTLQNVIITKSNAEIRCISFGKSDQVFLNNCSFYDNTPRPLLVWDSRDKYNETLIENLFINNNNGSFVSGNGTGGGISIGGSLNYIGKFVCKVVNTELTENHCTFPYSNPVGFLLTAIDGAKVIAVNSTIGNNTAVSTALNTAAISIGSGGEINMYNTIVYNPLLPWEVVIGTLEEWGSWLSMYNSLIRGGASNFYTQGNYEINWGDGIITTNPQWEGTGTYPYKLQATSPCINTGTPFYSEGMELPYLKEENGGLFLYAAEGDTVKIPVTDLAGNPRILGDRIDMGAYEYQDTGVYVKELFCDIEIPHIKIFPNPFSVATTISITNKNSCHIRIDLFDINGHLIKVLMNSKMPQGAFDIIWDGTSQLNKPIKSGTYVCRMIINGRYVVQHKIIFK